MTAILILIIVILALRIYAYKMELKALKRYIEKTSRLPEKKEIEACVKEVIKGISLKP